MKLRQLTVLIGFIGLAFLFASCASTQNVIVQGANETFHRGMDLLHNEDYAKAKEDFDIVVKQYPASAYADSAQFYLAETYFKRDEYLTAAFEFMASGCSSSAISLIIAAIKFIALFAMRLF